MAVGKEQQIEVLRLTHVRGAGGGKAIYSPHRRFPHRSSSLRHEKVPERLSGPGQVKQVAGVHECEYL